MGSVSRKYRVHLSSHLGDNSLPRPLLLDYHGWTEHAGGHEDDGHDFFAVADEDEEGGFLLVTPEGMGDVGEGRFGTFSPERVPLTFLLLRERVGQLERFADPGTSGGYLRHQQVSSDVGVGTTRILVLMR